LPRLLRETAGHMRRLSPAYNLHLQAMKTLLVTLVLLVATQKNFAQGSNDLAGNELKGRVRIVTEQLFYDGQKKCGMKTVDKYNGKGYLTEEVHNDYMLKLNVKKRLKYDTMSNGNIARVSEYDDSEHLVHTIDYVYDGENRVTMEIDNRWVGTDSTKSKKEFQYDSSGHRIQETNYTAGTPDLTTDHTYDNKGRIIKTRSYDKAGKTIMLYDYDYIAYDAWVHCEKQSRGVRTHYFRSLDTLGTPVKQTTYMNDFSKETIENYSDFDAHGNWLKLIVTGNLAEPYSITRTIGYYDKKR